MDTLNQDDNSSRVFLNKLNIFWEGPQESKNSAKHDRNIDAESGKMFDLVSQSPVLGRVN